MGTVSIEIPGPGTYQVQCDPKLPALADGGTSGDVLAGKQFYNDQNAPVTGTMPNNPPQAVELSGGNSYTIPRGFHDGTGKVTGVGTVLPDLPSPAGAGDILAGKQAVSGDGTRLTGIMPNNPPEDVEVSGGESYQIPEGYHTGTGKVTGKGTVLPELTDPATAADILIRKEVIDQSGQELAGTMPNNGAVSAELAAGGSYTIPAGYHNGQGKVISTAVPLPSLSDPAVSGDIISGKEAIDGTGAKVTGTMPAVAAATPTISVSPDGLITATAQQAEGYVEAATETAAQQLETQGAQTIVPGTADQTVPAGKFLTGAQTIQGDAGLLPENIKKGVSLFGVDGSYEPGLPADVRTITLAADPPEGGTVSGGGVASEGMTVTVEATPADGYLFDAWTEDDVCLTEGDQSAYTFPVNGDRSLIAAFIQSQYTAGVDWWVSTLPFSARWKAVTYGNGKFVAVAYNNNKAAYSTDGITWTETTMPSTANWQSITYGDGKFVAVAYNNNKAAYSTDGITWTETTMPSTANWQSITYGDGKFVAVALNSNKAAYSEDGIVWSASTLPASANWVAVTYGDGKFVAIAQDSTKATYSIDGINWTTATLPSSVRWRSVTYGNGRFVAVSDTTVAAYSDDGKTWIAMSLPSASYWYSISYGSRKFVALSYGSTKVAYSTDGKTWTEAMLPSTANWQDVTYGDGRFVAVAMVSDKAAYSSVKGPGE